MYFSLGCYNWVFSQLAREFAGETKEQFQPESLVSFLSQSLFSIAFPNISGAEKTHKLKFKYIMY